MKYFKNIVTVSLTTMLLLTGCGNSSETTNNQETPSTDYSSNKEIGKWIAITPEETPIPTENADSSSTEQSDSAAESNNSENSDESISTINRITGSTLSYIYLKENADIEFTDNYYNVIDFNNKSISFGDNDNSIVYYELDGNTLKLCPAIRDVSVDDAKQTCTDNNTWLLYKRLDESKN